MMKLSDNQRCSSSNSWVHWALFLLWNLVLQCSPTTLAADLLFNKYLYTTEQWLEVLFCELLQSQCFKQSDWFCAAEWNNDFSPVDWGEGGDLETSWERSQDMLKSLNRAQRLNRAFVPQCLLLGWKWHVECMNGGREGNRCTILLQWKKQFGAFLNGQPVRSVSGFSRRQGKHLLRP